MASNALAGLRLRMYHLGLSGAKYCHRTETSAPTLVFLEGRARLAIIEQTMMGATTVDPNMIRHPTFSLRSTKMTETMSPRAIPKAASRSHFSLSEERRPTFPNAPVHICHCMTKAPRMGAGAHSAV